MQPALFLTVFLVYLLTSVPVIYFEDNPMFITTAYTLGFAHPPGYPLINMLGNLAGALPFGNFAFRCNVLSGVFAAAAVLFFFRSALIFAQSKWLALCFSLIFAFSGNLWTQAVIFEVYTLFFALFFFLLWVSLSGRLNDFRWVLISAFLFGLGVTNHLALSVTLPGFIALWVKSKKSWKYQMGCKNFVALMGAGVFSWTINLYTLLRSLSPDENILFSWGKVNGFGELARFMTGYKTYKEFSFNSEPLVNRWDLFLEYVSTAIPLWGWLFIVACLVFGVYKIGREEPKLLLSFTLFFSALLFYSFLQHAAMDIMLVIPWGLGILVALFGIDRCSERSKKTVLIIGTPMLVCFFMVQFSRYDFHKEYSAYDYFSDISDTLPQSGNLRLEQGVQLNYILLYGINGPGEGFPKKKKNDSFSPYTVSSFKLPSPYGLFHSNRNMLKGSKTELLWGHIRSYPFIEKEGPRVRRLTRNMFKDLVSSRITLQRGYSYLQTGDHQKATELFRAAAGKNTSPLLKDAINMLAYRNSSVAEILLEVLLEKEVSPGLVRLLGRAQALSKEKKTEVPFSK